MKNKLDKCCVNIIAQENRVNGTLVQGGTRHKPPAQTRTTVPGSRSKKELAANNSSRLGQNEGRLKQFVAEPVVEQLCTAHDNGFTKEINPAPSGGRHLSTSSVQICPLGICWNTYYDVKYVMMGIKF